MFLLGRPTQYVGGFIFYPCFFFLSSFFFLLFFRRLISEVAERNWTKIGHMVGSKCNLKTHVRNLGYSLPLQIGGPKTTFFGRLRNFNGVVPPEKIGGQKILHLFSFSTTSTLNDEYLLNKTPHRQSGNRRVSYVVAKFHKLWSTNGSKPDRRFYPPSLFMLSRRAA